MPIGLCFNSAVLLISRYTNMPDFVKGFLLGIGIALIAAPILLRKFGSPNI